MIRFLFSLVLGLYTNSILGQVWTYSKGSNAFDGDYKSASIIGVGYDFPYTKPRFVVNIFNGELAKPNIYLNKVPSGACDNNRVFIKFDNEDKIYEPNIFISKDNEHWFLDFQGLVMEEVTDSIKKFIKFYMLPHSNTLKIHTKPSASSEIIGLLSQKDTIDLIYLDTPYWVCRCRGIIGYLDEMYLSGVQKYPVAKYIYMSYTTIAPTDSELKFFINDLKTHSLMHVRLQSDCVKSDFQFSLKGSTIALNYVFSK